MLGHGLMTIAVKHLVISSRLIAPGVELSTMKIGFICGVGYRLTAEKVYDAAKIEV